MKKTAVVLSFVLCASVAAAQAPAPADGAGWYRLATERLQAGNADEAIAAYEKAWALGARPRFVIGYNLACLHARAGHADAAFDWLDEVHAMGITPEQAAADADLNALHADARWPTLMQKMERAAHPCRQPRHRELDFWVGEWSVADASGQAVGSSKVERILDGCVVLENWTGRLGDSGKSFNFYDDRQGQWQQTWIDDKGVLTEFRGRLEGGAMHYLTRSPGRDGKPRHNRMTFTPMPDGRVRQFVEQTPDDGTTWSVVYDFYYTRQGGG